VKETPSRQKSMNSIELRRGDPERWIRNASALPSVFSTRMRLPPGKISHHEDVLPALYRMLEEVKPWPDPLICR
jgi:hypothetical protein